MRKKIEMFIVTHKPLFVKTSEIYTPIKVGKNKISQNYICDSTGDNISSKNSNYCELTAFYWLWKNYDLCEYIGIVHYRRFFVKGVSCKILDENYILKQMNNYDVILPYPNKAEPNVWKYFVNSKSCNNEEELIILDKLIKEKSPTYHKTFKEVMESTELSYCNMFIMNSKNYNAYCEWLFDILFEYEKMVDIRNYNIEEARIFGYMSEFLLNVWIRKNNLKIKYEDIIKYENNYVKDLLKKIKQNFKVLKRR